MPLTIVLIALPLIVILSLVYLRFIRPWQLTWGARPDEISRPLPGDEIVPQPTFNATRAVTIHARPEHIYPWIPQMGVNRAGWYSYDVLDNLARHSAESILPQFQNVKPGDLIPMSPDGKYGIWIKEFVADQYMLWWDQETHLTSWVWSIVPEGSGNTRLITRVRTKYTWLSPMVTFNLLIEFCDIIMMRRCMLNIKRRAETLARQSVKPQETD